MFERINPPHKSPYRRGVVSTLVAPLVDGCARDFVLDQVAEFTSLWDSLQFGSLPACYLRDPLFYLPRFPPAKWRERISYV